MLIFFSKFIFAFKKASSLSTGDKQLNNSEKDYYSNLNPNGFLISLQSFWIFVTSKDSIFSLKGLKFYFF